MRPNRGKRKSKKSRADAKKDTRPRQISRAALAPSLAAAVVPRLSSNPFWPEIKDACEEMNIIEKRSLGSWLRWLWKKANAVAFDVADEDVERRLCEVYRLCFVASGESDLTIVTKFAAHHPGLVFRCPWIRELVESCARFRFYDPRARKILLALGGGFSRAGAERDWMRSSLPSRREAARLVQNQLAKELSVFLG
jgi:hypothetical protein